MFEKRGNKGCDNRALAATAIPKPNKFSTAGGNLKKGFHLLTPVAVWLVERMTPMTYPTNSAMESSMELA